MLRTNRNIMMIRITITSETYISISRHQTQILSVTPLEIPWIWIKVQNRRKRDKWRWTSMIMKIIIIKITFKADTSKMEKETVTQFFQLITNMTISSTQEASRLNKKWWTRWAIPTSFKNRNSSTKFKLQ